MQELKYLSAYEIGELVNSKQISPVDVVLYFKERIEKYNKDINAFTYVNFEYALEEAKKLKSRIDAGERVGPFAGVPFALKDFLPSKKGWPCTHGGVKCLSNIDEYSSVFCEAMEKAGGIAIGKTNAPAFGFRGTTDNLMFGPTRNPFNTSYNAGGSSGGSAAAVAAGLVPIAEGGDAGGSIRIPASWCNLIGYKSTNVFTPNVCRPDAFAATHPFCTCGGLVKSVKDSEILATYMQNYNRLDPQSRSVEEMRDKEVKNIALTYDFNLFNTDSEIKHTLDKIKEALESLGYNVDIIHFNFKHTAREFAEMWCKMISIDTTIELELAKKEGIDIEKEHPEDLPKEFVYYANEVRKMNFMDYYNYNLIRTDLYDNFLSVFDKYDILLSPVTSCVSVRNNVDRNTKGPDDVEPLIGFTQTFLANYLGLPSISVPASISKEGLPVGVQLTADRLYDKVLWKVAGDLEKVNPWTQNYKHSMK